jgi:hypothetical protein
MNATSQMTFKAVEARLLGELATSRAILQNYWENPSAIGEHPNLPEEVYKALAQYTEAYDRLSVLSALGVGQKPPHVPLR